MEFNLTKPIHVHFMGIGGISMSSLAELLLSKGFTVSGSDAHSSELTDFLEKQGATVQIGQRSSNITDDIDLVVYTAAIHPDNAEYQAAVNKGLPMMSRAELLGQIMKFYQLPIAVSGTHGKTTTTSMLSEILLHADTDPTLSIGGILKSIGGNSRIGSDKYFLFEACEYTNSFLSFFPKISVILNIDADHLDFFKDLDDIRASFRKFAELLPADGALVISNDIPNLEEITHDLPCRIVTFGAASGSDYTASDITYDEYAHPTFTCHKPDGSSVRISLHVPGEHNVYNALSAVAVADLLQITSEDTLQALSHFGGTDRRFEYKGSIGDVTVIDDYAHHPTEIRATLNAAHNYPHKEIWCVFQPHTFSRTKALMSEFADALSLADHVVLADIYAARETDHLGISSATLRDEILKLGADCHYLPTFDEIENFLLENCTPGDLLITMGAGDVHIIGENLLGE